MLEASYLLGRPDLAMIFFNTHRSCSLHCYDDSERVIVM